MEPVLGEPAKLILKEDLSIGLKEGKGYYYDIFDPQGRYMAKVFLEVRPRVWKKNKMYTIYEDKEGYRYIKRYEVEWR